MSDGEWFDPTPPPVHKCRLPDVNGSRRGWRCNCGKAYRIEILSARDTNPGESPYQWRRAPVFDRKAKADG